MKLDKLAEALHVVRTFKLDAMDLLLLDRVLHAKREKGEATIMVIMKCGLASDATINKRLKKLVNAGMLLKGTKAENLRFKPLESGAELETLLVALENI